MVNRLQFDGHLIVSTHGNYEAEPYATPQLKDEWRYIKMIEMMCNELPRQQKILLACGMLPYIRDSARIFRDKLRSTHFLQILPIRGLDGGHNAEEMLNPITSTLSERDVHNYGILTIVTTAAMSGHLSLLHTKGRELNNLKEGSAYLIVPDGSVSFSS